MSADLDIAQVRQQIETGVNNARRQLENYRALAELAPIYPVQPAPLPPPRRWSGFLMLIRRPLRPMKRI